MAARIEYRRHSGSGGCQSAGMHVQIHRKIALQQPRCRPMFGAHAQCPSEEKEQNKMNTVWGRRGLRPKPLYASREPNVGLRGGRICSGFAAHWWLPFRLLPYSPGRRLFAHAPESYGASGRSCREKQHRRAMCSLTCSWGLVGIVSLCS